MMAFGATGLMEMLMVLLLGGGLNLPVGLPPLPDDPKMSQVAPDQALFYMNWAGTADADPKSTNGTERILADPQVKFMLKSIEDAIMGAISREMRGDEEKQLVKHGHLLIKQMLLRPTTLYLSKLEPFGDVPVVEAGLVVHFGKDAAGAKAAMEVFEKLIAQQLGGEFQVMPEKDGGLRRLPMPDGEAPLMAWGFEGEYMMIAIGKETAARLRGAITGGKTPQWLSDVKKKIALPRNSSLTYLNVPAIIKQVGPMITGELHGGPDEKKMFDNALAALGLDKVKFLASATGFDDTKFVTRSLIATDGQPGGLFKLINSAGLTPADLADVPKDADLAFVMKINPVEIWDEALKIITTIEPRAKRDIERDLPQAEDEIGFSIREDLLDSLGDVVSVYNSPGDGGLVFTGLTGVVKVKNAKKAQKVVEQLEKMFDQEFNRMQRNEPDNPRVRRYEIKTLVVGQHKVRYINPVGDDWVVAPAWCLTGDRFIMAAYPQMVKAYLLRSTGNPADAATTLAGVPQVKALFGSADSGPTMVSYMDTPEMFKKFYPLLHPLGTVALAELQREGINLDIAALPTASAFLPHLTPDTGSVKWTADGVLSEGRMSLPMSGAASLLPMLSVLWASEARMMHGHIEDFNTVPAVPHDDAAPARVERPVPRIQTQAAKRAVAMNDLRQIGIAIFVYHSEKNKAAPSLADLKPYLGKEIKTDPWGQAYIYYGKTLTPAAKDAAKTPFASTSHNIDGKRMVLYGDAHVELIDEKDFKKQMDDAKLTYEKPVEIKAADDHDSKDHDHDHDHDEPDVKGKSIEKSKTIERRVPVPSKSIEKE